MLGIFRGEDARDVTCDPRGYLGVSRHLRDIAVARQWARPAVGGNSIVDRSVSGVSS